VPRGRAAWIAALAVAATIGTPQQLVAQLVTSLDAGLSWVEYDGFLPSSAISLTPTVGLRRASGSVVFRGTVLRFESGNHSLQGLISASTLTRPLGRLRGEGLASAGASTYRQFPGFGHVLGRARLHWLSPGRGAWIAASLGQTAFKRAARPVTGLSAGVWSRNRATTFDVSVGHTSVGDTTFTDFEGAGHWPLQTVEFNGLMGVRVWSHGAGHGVYGEANANVRLASAWTLVLGAGRYPTDPTRGSVSGRYLTAGVRLSGLTRQRHGSGRPSAPGIQLFRRVDESGESATTGANGAFTAATLELRTVAPASFVIVIRADWAQSVEIMGDFTGWEPVALTRERSEWQVTLVLAPGVHRMNVRLDGGDWTVPHGVTAGEDDFGGRVGTLVVP
jgi:hypothetical protein